MQKNAKNTVPASPDDVATTSQEEVNPSAGKELDVAAEYVSLDALKPWAKNPKSVEPEDVRELARSIRRFGFGPPIVARRANGEIISGHLRYAAAKRLRLARVPVRFMDLSESEAHVMAIADTKLHERRTFEKDKLGEVLAELQADDVELEIGTGFTDSALEKLIGSPDDLDFDDEDAGKSQLKGLKYSVIVECADEKDQAKLLERLERDGYDKCRPLMS